MSDLLSSSTSSLAPVPRLLKRAGNILNSNGEVVKELDDGSLTPGVFSRNRNGFGASIKRKIFNLRRSNSATRSKSLRVEPTVTLSAEGAKKRQKGHSKSLSDLTTTSLKPDLIHSTSSSSSRAIRPHEQTLESVLENTGSSSQRNGSEEPSSPAIGNVQVPQLLQQGTPMTKVSAKTQKKVVFRLEADLGQIIYESKKHKIVPLENIKEIRCGHNARYYREQFHLSQEYEDRWLTIIYVLDGNYKTLHLVAATKDVFLMWDRTLRELHAVRMELMRGLGNIEMRQALWEKQYWKGADEEKDQKLNFEEVEKLCRRLNINSSKDDLLRLFRQADHQNRSYLDFNDFRRFVKLLKARPEIVRLYKKLQTQNSSVFNFGVFEKFMIEKQESTANSSQLQALFKKYATSDSDVMTLEGFTSFLMSPDNSAFMDQHQEVWQDMTQPLPDYFISSSHNTYLVGHQLVGDSTIEGYIRALLHSCRSVEVDIYDGDVEPMIFHGKTLTSKVSLRNVCKAIAKYGFVASPYPIIISAEIHCSLQGQDQIAQIMIEEFGASLVRVPVDSDAPGEKIAVLPSPEDLKYKILLKAKNFNLLGVDSLDSDTTSSQTDTTSSASDSDVFEFPKDVQGHTYPINDEVSKNQSRISSDVSIKDQLNKARTHLMQRVRSVKKPADTSELLLSQRVLSQSPPSMSPLQAARSPSLTITPIKSSVSPPPSATGFLKSPLPISSRHSSDVSDRPKAKMSLQLLALLVYTVGVKCRGINKKEEYAPEHMFSLSENMANKMMRFGMWDLIKHNKTHLVRIYPKGTRLSSTNYEPHRFWAAGAQLVAINWQTSDMGYMINHAMFQRNGRSGYVLKPDALRVGTQKEVLARKRMYEFEVDVISAQQLPRPKDSSGHEVPERGIVDPFVEVTVYVPDWPTVDTKEKEKVLVPMNIPSTPSEGGPTTVASTPGHTVSSRTSVVKKNGFNPVWEEKLRIPFVCVGDMMDLVFVRFIVRQEDKETEDPLAVYCASLGSLQHGYRHLPLHDSQLSQYLFSTLFVKIKVRDVTIESGWG